jgi:hypothetical protein
MSSAMLRRRLAEDVILEYLTKSSILTAAQLDTILCELQARTNLKKLKDRVARRDSRNITLGAYLGTKKQAYRRVKKAVNTILLLIYLGAIPLDTLPSLYRVAELLSQMDRHILREEEKRQIKKLLNETVDRLVVISQ